MTKAIKHYSSEAAYATDKWRDRKVGSKVERKAYTRALRRAKRHYIEEGLQG